VTKTTPARWLVLIAAALLAALNLASAEESPTRWVATWTASPQPLWDNNYPASVRIPESLNNSTVRQIAHVSLGGKRWRVVISNRFGKTPLHLGEAHLGLSLGAGNLVAGSDRKLTFGGHASVDIPPGAPMVSDPVELDVPPFSNLAVSIYLPDETPLTTFHWDGLQTAYIAPGNVSGNEIAVWSGRSKSRVFVSGLFVETKPGTRVIATLGDSITDGNATTPDANHRWPDLLAQRFANKPVAVINAGISGARLLKDRMGTNALARFDDDVLNQPGIASVIVLMGINDIGWAGSIDKGAEIPKTEALITAYRQLIARAHLHGIRIVGGTLLPFEGAPYYTLEKEKVRQSLNQWIRTSGEFDAVADFDALLRDPTHPGRLLPAFDIGDHLHPNDAGSQAMADGLDLKALLP
jgi:lysophospholipase L1-like esterase